MTAGSVMAAELAEQPGVLDRLVRRHVADRDRVAAALPGRPGSGALAGTVLLARGSSDNVAVYGRYLVAVGHVPADEAGQDLGLLGELGCHHGSGGHWRSSCWAPRRQEHQYGITMLGAAVRGVWE